MILNRKSTKVVSHISFFIGLIMFVTALVIVNGQDFQLQYFAEKGIDYCHGNLIDLFVTLIR